MNSNRSEDCLHLSRETYFLPLLGNENSRKKHAELFHRYTQLLSMQEISNLVPNEGHLDGRLSTVKLISDNQKCQNEDDRRRKKKVEKIFSNNNLTITSTIH